MAFSYRRSAVGAVHLVKGPGREFEIKAAQGIGYAAAAPYRIETAVKYGISGICVYVVHYAYRLGGIILKSCW